jgi:Zn-dependent protease
MLLGVFASRQRALLERPEQVFGWPPTLTRLLLLPALAVGFTVHELAHAFVAYLLGDTSQVARKRLSLNPLRHASVVGTITFLLIGIGWAKPVSVDWTRFRMRNQPLGMFFVSISGPLANLLTGLLVVLGMALTGFVVGQSAGVSWADALGYMVSQEVGFDAHGLVVALSYDMFAVNILLALFNLIPLPPLDGFQALMSLVAVVRRLSAPKGRTAGTVPTPPATAGSSEDTRSAAQIHFDIGLEYHRQGQLDEAIARYRQAIAQGEGFALAQYNLGLAFWAKGREAFAVTAFKSASQTADLALRAEAEQRLRELAWSQQDPAARREPPSPLGASPAPKARPPAAENLDPAVQRGLWLRLGIGAATLILLATAAWLFVTMTTLSALSVG